MTTQQKLESLKSVPFTPRCANCGYSADDLYADAANTIPDEIDPICCEVPEAN